MNIDNISKFRLAGEACPADLTFLVKRFLPLLSEVEVEFNDQADWQPWADKSYLTEKDLADPDIVANVQAIDDTFALISFVAEFPNGEYLGYWRGPENRAIKDSPLVLYSSDGRFSLCGADLFEALHLYTYDDDVLTRIKNAAIANGFELDFDCVDDIETDEVVVSPDTYHETRYYQLKGK
ncbi:hypothetical protein [Shewanella fidelis]|uniref:Uncharacterized protein n=1 Tax=Shewanella fidelis TaxID=173509 RepID=A0AAW8NQJ9_9GAMM|nr:hypothetical protein [Shewanella fidelis]MDR8525016.1 hypothetical protein [Shewanella fidelis]MDW4811087.1 hypothetical protein [Shewanella fidelis]MDW4815134.1 hypothetical protein [Shewanella fidelis]MDW4819224.1 hypothetical protein [Shewanella fidelis]MDW4823098.1 hypothetical protein [Shewanella fidelis]